MKKPEEIIMAVLAALWVILTYFVLTYIGAHLETSLTITGLTLLWCVVAFVFWQKNLMAWLWPVFIGLLIACWWPFWDWFAIKDVVDTSRIGDTLLMTKPWYATWAFKFAIAIVPTLIAYVAAWKLAQKRKQKAVTPAPLA
jgi:hypothetical protein